MDTINLQAKLFHGFADPSRLAILEALRERPRTVGEVVAATGLSQPNVSNHLACLRDCGLVTSRPAGRYAFDQVCRIKALKIGKRLGLTTRIDINFMPNALSNVETCLRTTIRAGRSGST